MKGGRISYKQGMDRETDCGGTGAVDGGRQMGLAPQAGRRHQPDALDNLEHRQAVIQAHRSQC